MVPPLLHLRRERLDLVLELLHVDGWRRGTSGVWRRFERRERPAVGGWACFGEEHCSSDGARIQGLPCRQAGSLVVRSPRRDFRNKLYSVGRTLHTPRAHTEKMCITRSAYVQAEAQTVLALLLT